MEKGPGAMMKTCERKNESGAPLRKSLQKDKQLNCKCFKIFLPAIFEITGSLALQTFQ